jgi:hypothetical protein
LARYRHPLLSKTVASNACSFLSLGQGTCRGLADELDHRRPAASALAKTLNATPQRSKFVGESVLVRIDGFLDQRQNYGMGKGRSQTCPTCGATMILALPADGKGKRIMQCVECDRPDPLKSDAAKGWLTSELQPPK